MLFGSQPAASGKIARDSARRALALVERDRVEGERIWRDAELNAALDPLRSHPALGVCCARCGHGLGWVALDQQGAHVVSANRRVPPKRRRGGIADLADVTEPGWGRARPGWVEDADAGLGKVRPTGERPGAASGVPARRAYRCRCGTEHTVTNHRLLVRYLTAIVEGTDTIELGRRPAYG